MKKAKRLSKLVSYLLTLCFLFAALTYALPTYVLGEIEADSGDDISSSSHENVFESKLILAADDVPEVIDFAEAQKKGHVLRLREKEPDEHTVIFLNDNNTETMYVFAEPIKYTDSNGNIKDKSTTLSLSNNAYVTEQNDICVRFPNNVNDGVSVSKDGISISVTPIFTQGNGTMSTGLLANDNISASDIVSIVSDNKMTYVNTFGQGVDLQYTPLYSGFKEDIILDSYTGVSEFSFAVKTNGLYPVENENGSVSFYAPATDAIKAEMMQVVCYDANNRFADGSIRITPVKENQLYLFTVIADVNFLTDENTEYPVSVDPTITLNTESAIEDTAVYSGKPNNNYASHKYLNVGYVDSTYKIGYLFVKFPTLASNAVFNQLSSTDITSATLSLYTASGGSGDEILRCFQHNGSAWDVSTVTYSNITFGSMPMEMPRPDVPSSGGAEMQINMLAPVRNWANDSTITTPNKGIFIGNYNNSSSSECRDFLSVEYAQSSSSRAQYMPTLEITFNSFSRIVVTNYPTTMYTGETYACDAKYIVDGVVIATHNGTSFTFTSGDTTKLTTTQGNLKGVLTAKKAGTVRVTVSFNGASTYFNVQILATVVKSGASQDTYTINNDQPNPYCDIDAYISRGATSYEYDQDITYSIYSYGDYDGDVSVNANTGVVTVTHPSDHNPLFAHECGSITVRATSPYAIKDITVDIDCLEPLDQTSGTSQVPLYDGRYIRIAYPSEYTDDDIDNEIFRGLTEVFRSLVEAFSPERTFEKIDTNFTFENGWWQYDDPQGYGYDRRFFELIRTSKVVFITTHGETGSISINTAGNDEYKIYVDDILALHKGYFRYCDLIVLTSCNGATPSTNAMSLAEAFYERGAKCVIGFGFSISYTNHEAFENEFFNYALENNATKTVGEILAEINPNNNFEGEIIVFGDEEIVPFGG
ncbi:MAG: DNRLRE domain-containing protein [Clostridia bacterium]|nr:DNRLRE domain-containing protein [Clostridia bacterium]